MKFNTIIIGGGLSGLTAGIALAEKGQDVAIVSAGQSTLHFTGGSLDLLGYDDKGNEVYNPLQAIAALPAGHPYKKVENPEALCSRAQQLLAAAGIATNGSAAEAHWRLSPIGALKPTWLTLEGMATVANPETALWKRVAVVNIINFLDFPTKLLAGALRDRGVEVDLKAVTLPQLTALRKSPTEMRATNIAKVLEREDLIAALAAEINRAVAGANYDQVLVPSVLGIKAPIAALQLLSIIDAPASFVATLPPSTPGMRLQAQLRRRFEELGGTFITGDQVTAAQYDGNRLISVATAKLEGTPLEADNFVLATGSFKSRGLVADFERLYEPALGVDVDDLGAARRDRTAQEVFDPQPYMLMGVRTTAGLRCLRDGQEITNLYAAGSVLSHCNSIKLACAAGVDLLTALQVAENITK